METTHAKYVILCLSGCISNAPHSQGMITVTLFGRRLSGGRKEGAQGRKEGAQGRKGSVNPLALHRRGTIFSPSVDVIL